MATSLCLGGRILGTAILFAVSGCAHGTITAVSPGRPLAAGKVATVTVDATGATAAADRRQAYESLNGGAVIEGAIRARLERDGLSDPNGDTAVQVEVGVFRLRSTGTAFWAGFLAGIDKLEGTVQFSQGAAEPSRYAFVLSSSEEWYFKYGASARLRALANELAEKIAEVLAQSPGSL
jgi:hypothetical protein